jgi:hypothetical protein
MDECLVMPSLLLWFILKKFFKTPNNFITRFTDYEFVSDMQPLADVLFLTSLKKDNEFHNSDIDNSYWNRTPVAIKVK